MRHALVPPSRPALRPRPRTTLGRSRRWRVHIGGQRRPTVPPAPPTQGPARLERPLRRRPRHHPRDNPARRDLHRTPRTRPRPEATCPATRRRGAQRPGMRFPGTPLPRPTRRCTPAARTSSSTSASRAEARCHRPATAGRRQPTLLAAAGNRTRRRPLALAPTSRPPGGRTDPDLPAGSGVCHDVLRVRRPHGQSRWRRTGPARRSGVRGVGPLWTRTGIEMPPAGSAGRSSTSRACRRDSAPERRRRRERNSS